MAGLEDKMGQGDGATAEQSQALISSSSGARKTTRSVPALQA